MEMCAGKLEYLKCAVRNYGIFCLCFISVLIFMLTLQMHFNDFLSTWEFLLIYMVSNSSNIDSGY